MATGPKADRKPNRGKSRLHRLYDASPDILELVPMARDIELDASIPYGISAVDHAKRVIPKIRSLYARLNKVRDLVGDCFEELGGIALKLSTLNLNVLWTGVSGYDAALWRATDLLHRINLVCMVAAQPPTREPFDVNSYNDELYAQHWQIVQCTLAASPDMKAEDMLIVRRVQSEMAAIRSIFALKAEGTAEPAPKIRMTVTLDPPQAVLDGKPFALTADGADFVKSLLDAKGDWLSSSNLPNIPRPDRVRKALPRLVRELIESAPSKGFRIPQSVLA
jgi:hypothetical protein